jgi:hypothetical protein
LLSPDFVLVKREGRVRDSDCEEHQAVAVKGVEGDECDDGLSNADE